MIIWVDETYESYIDEYDVLYSDWAAYTMEETKVVYLGSGSSPEEALGNAIYRLTKEGSIAISEVHTRNADGTQYYPEV